MLYVAYKMLVGDRGKYFGIVLGVSFAAFIMTQQPGIFVGLMTRTYSFISDISLPDIWVMDSTVRFIDDGKTMPEKNLSRVASVEGVAWAVPMFKSNIQARLRNGTYQNCNIIGVDDNSLIGLPAMMIDGKKSDLWQSDSVIVNEEGSLDKLAHEEPDGSKKPLKVGQELELNDHRAVVVGIAKTMRTFQSLPVIFTTYSQAKQMVPPQRNLLSFVLVKAKDGQNPKALARKISKKTGLKALTKEEFEKETIDYYMKYTGIPINFGVSVLLGFLVGASIAGQTFYNFTQENLRYYGVLKAMGLSEWALVRMVVFQSIIVCCIGYGIGLLGTSLFAYATSKSILAFRFPWELLLFSITSAVIISALAALISIYKVIKLEPAIVFKS